MNSKAFSVSTACVFLAVIIVLSGRSRAGSVLLGQIPIPTGEGTILGATFAGPNRLLAENSHRNRFYELSLADGSFNSTTLTTGAIIARGLAFQTSTQQLYDVRQFGLSDALHRVPINGGSATRVNPAQNLGAFNFVDMSFAPDGTLWLLTDGLNGVSNGRAVLYKVNPDTGESSFITASVPETHRTFTSIGINVAGDIFVASGTVGGGSPGKVFQIDPASGALSFVTATDLPIGGHFTSLDLNPATGRWYGVQASTSGVFLREVTGIPIPEPPMSCLIGCVLSVFGIRRR